MIALSAGATSNRDITYSPLPLAKDGSPKHPDQDIRSSVPLKYGVRLGMTGDDGSKHKGIQGYEPLEKLAFTAQPGDNRVYYLSLWGAESPAANAAPDYAHWNIIRHLITRRMPELSAIKVLWGDNRAFQPHPSRAESPAANAAPDYAHWNIIRHLITRRMPELSAIKVLWGDNRAFQPHPSRAESPTANTDSGPAYNTILNEILAELDNLVRWREEWDEDDHEHEPEKPSDLALSNAKRVVTELLSAAISEGKDPFTPFISYDEDDYITLAWRNGKHELYLEITEDKTQYVTVWGINIDSEMDAGVPSKDNYLTLWEWLLDG